MPVSGFRTAYFEATRGAWLLPFEAGSIPGYRSAASPERLQWVGEMADSGRLHRGAFILLADELRWQCALIDDVGADFVRRLASEPQISTGRMPTTAGAGRRKGAFPYGVHCGP